MRHVLILFFLLSSLTITAQSPKTHKVQQGETIEEIAKLYLVSPYDIYALNPDALQDFKPNMVLVLSLIHI